MFTIAARADVIALFMVLRVYVSVYRIRNLERVCVSESESECVKVRQHLRMGIKLHRLSSSIVFVEKNRRDDAKDKTADITDARQSHPSARVRTKRSPASHQIAQEERARESYLPVITAERSRIHSLRVAALMMLFLYFVVAVLSFSNKNLKKAKPSRILNPKKTNEREKYFGDGRQNVTIFFFLQHIYGEISIPLSFKLFKGNAKPEVNGLSL